MPKSFLLQKEPLNSVKIQHNGLKFYVNIVQKWFWRFLAFVKMFKSMQTECLYLQSELLLEFSYNC
jgi:hypothetical protein